MVKFFSSRGFLAAYSGVLTVCFAATVLMGARSTAKNAIFDRITVHRIDVVEPDGTERLAISNRDAFPGLYLHGKEIPRPDRRDSAGFLFVNDEGTEDGGLIWGGAKDAQGRASSFVHLSFDQYDQDQTLSMGTQLEPDGSKNTSMTVSDVGPYLLTPQYYADSMRWKMMPHGPERAAAYAELKRKYPAAVQRGHLGRSSDDSVGLELSDKSGHVRAKLIVRADGQPALEFLDASGKVLRTISGGEAK